jgi:hypothetical protein
MPCMELFEEQSAEYQRSVFPVGAPVMSIEPASTNAWKRYAHAPYGTVLWRVALCPHVLLPLGVLVSLKNRPQMWFAASVVVVGFLPDCILV